MNKMTKNQKRKKSQTTVKKKLPVIGWTMKITDRIDHLFRVNRENYFWHFLCNCIFRVFI
jgi:hypothetical protein